MRPHSHRRLLIVALFIGFLGGALSGALIGAQFEAPVWRVSALIVGIVVGTISLQALVMHVVPVRCPACSGRMRCHSRRIGTNRVATYTCRSCGHSVCPSLEFSKRLFGAILDQFNGKDRR